MRKIILSMQMSLDGFVEGPNGDMKWVDFGNHQQWKDLFTLLEHVDTFFLGRASYPEYAKYWQGVLRNEVAQKDEALYARIAEKAQHVVFSKTLKNVSWENTRIAKDITTEFNALRQTPGKDIVVWGGATLASQFIDQNLVDEFRLVVNPVVLGSGKHLFRNLNHKQNLKLLHTKSLKSGAVIFYYSRVIA